MKAADDTSRGTLECKWVKVETKKTGKHIVYIANYMVSVMKMGAVRYTTYFEQMSSYICLK